MGKKASVDESKYLSITENALIELMDLCEPLEEEDIELLLEKTAYTRFNHLRVKLLEKREDYVQCLQLFVDGMGPKDKLNYNKEQIAKIFVWVENILDLLAAKKTVANPESTGKEDKFKQEVFSNFKGLVNMDAAATFMLVDEKFENEHVKFIESISDHSEEQFKYLEAMLQSQHKKIQACIQEYLMSGAGKEEAQVYMKL